LTALDPERVKRRDRTAGFVRESVTPFDVILGDIAGLGVAAVVFERRRPHPPESQR
jgi:hypothetical protein